MRKDFFKIQELSKFTGGIGDRECRSFGSLGGQSNFTKVLS